LPAHDLVVIGGSAGSLGALKTILRELPRDFPAAILVVIHLSSDSPTVLDEQLSLAGPLPVTYSSDGEAIQKQRVYIARPNFHLLVEQGKMCVQRGPRENRHRPAIDPLFRTAARVYGSRVVGVVLSGLQDDGSAGLYAVKQRGGIAIVQDPKEAICSEMPGHALAYADPQYVLPVQKIGPALIGLVKTDQDETSMSRSKKKTTAPRGSAKTDKPDRNLTNSYFDEGEGTPSVFACPECHGVLWEIKENEMVRFRCRVGHSYGPESLTTELSQASETALWAAMRALEEKAAMQRRMADSLTRDHKTIARLREQSVADDANARLIRDMIFRRDKALEAGHLKVKSESKKIA
jgi:two-component system, chemotaxis family, protein-glutamate methylesterase/glutaminase